MRNTLLIVAGLLLVATMFVATATSYGAPSPQTTETPEAPPPGGEVLIESGDYGASIVSAGLLRHYYFHIPTGYDGETLLPMLISFHGFTSNPQQNMLTTGFTHMADEEGFIAVFPEGYNDPAGWYAHDDAELEFPDDVQFTRDVISDMRARYAVDPTRIYITGFSNGGGMAHRIGCDMADVVAAVAAAGGTHIDEDPCLPARPVPMMGLHGREDSITPYHGTPDLLESIPEWAREWAIYNGCDITPTVNDSDETVYVEQWNNCEEGSTVILRTYEGMDHRWPPDGSEIVWDFVSQYTLPEEYVQELRPAAVSEYSKPGDYRINLFSADELRSFVLHVPANYDPNMPTPVVFSFHDFGSNPIGNVTQTRITLLADEENFIVVFPQGRGEPLAWFTEAEVPEGVATDTDFFVNILDRLNAELNVDNDRVFVTGFSLGGGMAHRIACDVSERVTAIAVVGGAHFIDQPCEPDNPVPVIAIHALDDEVTPFTGIDDVLQPIDEWADEWAVINGCAAGQETSEEGGFSLMEWQDCDAPTQLYTILTGGHTWFDSTNERIWDFFSQQ